MINLFFSDSKKCPHLFLPTAHLAVHNSWRAEMSQQVIHHVVLQLIQLHHTMVGWDKRTQSVLHQPEVALSLPLAKLLK